MNHLLRLATPEAVLATARAAGAIVRVDGDQLKARLPKRIDPAIVAALKANKPALLHLLAAPDYREWQTDEPHPRGPAALSQLLPDPPAGVARAEFWAARAARLDPSRSPANFPEAHWRATVESAQALCAEWGGQLAALNWDSVRIFGCHHLAPWQRLDCAGLALLLRDRRVLAVRADLVMLESAGGVRLPFRVTSPSSPGEVVLL